jgi:hypothetical protein
MSVTSFPFRYSGQINDQKIVGSGGLTYDQEAKIAQGSIDFSGTEFSALKGEKEGNQLSSISICCCNGCKVDDAGNSIASISKGNFTTRRRVEIFSGNTKVADFTNDGFARKIQGLDYSISVEVSGFYEGPSGFENVDGYQLPLSPKDGNTLEGSFEKQMVGNDGNNYTVRHTHTYIFHAGTTIELPEITHILNIDTNKSYVSNEEKFLRLVAESKAE